MTIGTKGLDAFIVSIETDISRGLYHFDIIGLGDRAVAESKSRILSAIKNSGFKSPKTAQQKITVLLSPAGTKKEGSHFDLPVAISYLQKCGYVRATLSDTVVAGELSLQGEIRPIKNILLIALTAKRLGYKRILAPAKNADEVALIDGIETLQAEDMREAIELLNGKSIRGEKIKSSLNTPTSPTENKSFSIDRVEGQENAKRALEISLAGKHHMAMYGPPGIGKSLIAKSIPELLPALSREEAVECRIVRECTSGSLSVSHSIFEAPFRDPHHTSSYSAIIGNPYRPGEISLAHNGILFMDEFAEFDRRALEALRQPMEDGCIKNHRSGGSQVLPANCIVVAALNMCRCGDYGSSRKKCVCSAQDMIHYSKKISGPLSDRIDMWVALREHSGSSREQKSSQESGSEIKRRIAEVRRIQKERVAKLILETSADNKGRAVRLTLAQRIRGSLKPNQDAIINQASTELGLSARTVDSTLLVARTIADLDYIKDSSDNVSNELKEEHILEALSYRKKF